MSAYRCIASNVMLPDVINEKIEYLSVNQAKQRGMVLPDFILDSKTIDPDKDAVILACSSEEDLHEMAITLEITRCFGNAYSDKKYLSQLTGRFTEERIQVLYNYVLESLNITDEIELWQLWEDELLEPKVIRAKNKIDLESLLTQYLGSNSIETPICIRISNCILER